jgi:hypothetical protein
VTDLLGAILRRRRGLRELALVLVVTMLYYATRGLAIGQERAALANARGLLDLERRLGLAHELGFNRWVGAHAQVAGALNAVYTYLHLPVLIAFAVWVYRRHQAAYPAIRNAFLGSAALGLTVYALLPLAPPRLLPDLGYTDTLAGFSNIHFETGAIDLFYNPYAAMPSLHFGWSLLVGIGLCRLGRRAPTRCAGLALPGLMLVAIVGTGNHFFLDAIGGALTMGLGLLLARWRMRTARPRRFGWPGSPARWPRRATN